ncbi:unnamed protein product [Trichogramma brassicae]|uniref:Uncharacterized protein n=1 Tax=Trichogramma brassicae TaxID=86971 RepID=A0A6H5INN7_9HYME|nr:unnamed protein product [Trichogramma brassicae]
MTNPLKVWITQRKLETLKSLRENVNWEIEDERRELLNQLHPLVKDWTDQLPNLRYIFRDEEIDWLLSAAISENYKHEDKIRFVEFVVRTGYKDEPDVDENGNISPRRTTLVHKAARNRQAHCLVYKLFKIYNRFDVNYVDELGRTHFHIACRYSLCEVEKFLEFGQDPNCHPPPLHEAINGYNTTAIRHLLKSSADPNSADEDGLTPLHKICKGFDSDIITVSMLFMISDEKHQLVKVDPLDKFGRTPLHYALMSKSTKKKMLQVLIKIKDANPNLADVDGLTPLHLICQRNYEEEDLVELFFEMCDEKHHLVPVDPLDNRGRTPLHYAIRGSHRLQGPAQIRRKWQGIILRRSTPVHLASNFCRSQWHAERIVGNLFRIYDRYDVNYVDESGHTHFHAACESGCYEIVERFLEIGLQDPNLLATENGDSPLNSAMTRGNREVVELLLRHGRGSEPGQCPWNDSSAYRVPRGAKNTRRGWWNLS